MQAALILMLGGGLGDLIDRVLNGAVVDYLNLLFMRFAVFNFADICVCVGAGLLVLYIFLDDLRASRSKDGSAAGAVNMEQRGNFFVEQEGAGTRYEPLPQAERIRGCPAAHFRGLWLRVMCCAMAVPCPKVKN